VLIRALGPQTGKWLARMATIASLSFPSSLLAQSSPLQSEMLTCSGKATTDEKLECFVAQLRILSACRGKLEKEEQVACFVDLAGAENKPTPPSTTEGSWRQSDSVDKLDGTKTLNLGLVSSDKIASGFGPMKEAYINFRCRKNLTEIYVVWPSYLGSGNSLSVKWRADGQPVATESWSPSSDGRAAFAPRPVDFAKKLLGKKELVFNIEPYNQGPQTVTFNIVGIDDAIKPLRAACNW